MPDAGWTNPRLEPFFYVAAPLEGIYDYTFAADAPSGENVDVISPISAELMLDVIPGNMKGVRIHAQTNSKEALLYRSGGELRPVYESGIEPLRELASFTGWRANSRQNSARLRFRAHVPGF